MYAPSVMVIAIASYISGWVRSTTRDWGPIGDLPVYGGKNSHFFALVVRVHVKNRQKFAKST